MVRPRRPSSDAVIGGPITAARPLRPWVQTPAAVRFLQVREAELLAKVAVARDATQRQLFASSDGSQSGPATAQQPPTSPRAYVRILTEPGSPPMARIFTTPPSGAEQPLDATVASYSTQLLKGTTNDTLRPALPASFTPSELLGAPKREPQTPRRVFDRDLRHVHVPVPGVSQTSRLSVLWDDSSFATAVVKQANAEVGAWRAESATFRRGASQRRQQLLAHAWRQAEAARRQAESDLQYLERHRRYEREDHTATMIQRRARQLFARRKAKRELEEKRKLHNQRKLAAQLLEPKPAFAKRMDSRRASWSAEMEQRNSGSPSVAAPPKT
jgi:hypothetical protein